MSEETDPHGLLEAAGITRPPARPETPELEKQRKIIPQAHQLSEFLDWLFAEGYHLGRYNDSDRAYDASPDPQELLARFFEIDLSTIEQERRTLLKYLREIDS